MSRYCPLFSTEFLAFSNGFSVAPNLMQELYDLCAAGKYADALPLQDKASHCWQILGKMGALQVFRSRRQLFCRGLVALTRMALT